MGPPQSKRYRCFVPSEGLVVLRGSLTIAERGVCVYVWAGDVSDNADFLSDPPPTLQGRQDRGTSLNY